MHSPPFDDPWSGRVYASVLRESQHRAEPRRAEEERDAVDAGAAVRVVPFPDQLDLVERPCLAQPEAVADAGGGRVPDADLHPPPEAEGADAEVPDPVQPRDRGAEVARRTAVGRPRSCRSGQRERARDRTEEQKPSHATAALARSSSPKRARATNCPIPGCAASSSFSTST